MKTHLLIPFFLIIYVCPILGANTIGSPIDSLMQQLQLAIELRDEYRLQKESRIAALQQEYKIARDDYERFDVLGSLLDEYSSYNTDSAFVFCQRREELADKIGDISLIRNARMNTANILVITGMYKDALDIMDSISCHELPEYLHPFYYHIRRTVYGFLSDYSIREDDKRKYAYLTNIYRDSLQLSNEPGSLAYSINKADQLNAEGEYRKAIQVIEDFMRKETCSIHDKARCTNTLSESYKNLGEVEKQKEQLIISSIADMQASVREYMSLRQLAVLLYQEGDVEHAYEYLCISMEDAALCNARLRILEINDIFPLVNKMYVDSIQKQRATQRISLIIISLLSLFLLIAIVYVYKQMQKVAAARKDVEVANDKLKQMNAELIGYNHDLLHANREIAENSYIKEEYIGRFMDQCSVYIEKLDSYRKTLNKLFVAGKMEELRNSLKSTSILDEELKAFYENFDNTFLKLFPSFVEDFNNLLHPDERIILKKDGQLNTELRIFALIRLGITDSVKIAQFLRYSVTTIYNYRTKVRNKAAGDRNKFEEEVQKISRENIKPD